MNTARRSSFRRSPSTRTAVRIGRSSFASIAEAAAQLPARTAVLGKWKAGRLIYHAFDLLYLDGFDLRNALYTERKRLPQTLLTDAPEDRLCRLSGRQRRADLSPGLQNR